MERTWPERAMAQARELSPRETHWSARIRPEWRKLLQRRLGLRGEQLALVLDLDPLAHLARPRSAGEVIGRQSQELAAHGVSSESIAAAVFFYLESCWPYLAADSDLAFGVIRFASAYQYLLLAGYARRREREQESILARFNQAEQRLQDFLAQLGEAYERERRHLARDLHDEIGHDLIVLKLYTEMIALDLNTGQVNLLRSKLREVVSLIQHALRSVRRLTFDLGPAVWKEQGFVPAVRLYARQFTRRTGIKIRVQAARLRAKLPPHCETALYRVLQGALSNVAAHAEAATVKITLASTRDSVMMKIEDDGKGFDVNRKVLVHSKAFGLRAMRERIELLGGTIQFSSQPARRRVRHRGTAIEVRLPLRCIEAA